MKSRSVGVIGVGLIGGSIALAARRAGYSVKLFEPFAKLDFRKYRGTVLVQDVRALVTNTQLVIIATPISALASLAKDLAALVQPETVVSDVASVKGTVVEILRPALSGRCEYLPSHPMAGSEKSGPESAKATLFDNSVTIISPEFTVSAESVRLVENFWRELGSRVLRSSVSEHDRLVAAISHLPHLVAALLIDSIVSHTPAALHVAGPGFRDVTRVVSGSPWLWTEILLANRLALLEHIANFRDTLEAVSRFLELADAKSLQAFLEAAKRNRDKLTG
jgi:prephenate dehydrogenase